MITPPPSTDEESLPGEQAVDERIHQPPAEAGRLGSAINRLGVIFAFGFVISMTVLLFEIVMRHILNMPTLWAHETTTFLCAVCFIFGGLYCAALDRHIRVVIIYDAVAPGIRRVLDVIISLVCAISAGFFAYASWLMVQRSIFMPNGTFRLETSGSAWNPPTPALLKLFLLATMIVLTIQFVIFAINHARGRR